MLGQAMDFNSMVWTIGLCLTLQKHHDDELLSLGAEGYCHGAQWSTSMDEGIQAMVVKAE